MFGGGFFLWSGAVSDGPNRCFVRGNVVLYTPWQRPTVLYNKWFPLIAGVKLGSFRQKTQFQT